MIKIKTTKTDITIGIPIDLILHVAKYHPQGEIKILDDQKEFFAKKIAEKLEDERDPDTGLTGLQKLIDDLIIEVVEDGYDGIDIIDPTNQ